MTDKINIRSKTKNIIFTLPATANEGETIRFVNATGDAHVFKYCKKNKTLFQKLFNPKEQTYEWKQVNSYMGVLEIYEY